MYAVQLSTIQAFRSREKRNNVDSGVIPKKYETLHPEASLIFTDHSPGSLSRDKKFRKKIPVFFEASSKKAVDSSENMYILSPPFIKVGKSPAPKLTEGPS
jgi:hypothetical protein